MFLMCSDKRARREKIMKKKLFKFLYDETAATAIEYGLIAAGIAVVIIPVIMGTGTKLKTTFTTIQVALK
jgi:pilus assembly protein Flp/PilA